MSEFNTKGMHFKSFKMTKNIGRSLIYILVSTIGYPACTLEGLWVVNNLNKLQLSLILNYYVLFAIICYQRRQLWPQIFQPKMHQLWKSRTVLNFSDPEFFKTVLDCSIWPYNVPNISVLRSRNLFDPHCSRVKIWLCPSALQISRWSLYKYLGQKCIKLDNQGQFWKV